jgi:hypothetical protein
MKKSNGYAPNRWGRLEQFQVPCLIFKDSTLSLSPSATATLMFLYFKAKGRYKQLLRQPLHNGDGYINIIASQKELSLKTGYSSRTTFTSAVKELVAGRWLDPPAQRRFKRGELNTNEYFLLDPVTGERLQTVPVSPYFTVPACIIRQDTMRWSLASLSSGEVALYSVMLFRANQQRNNTFRNDAVLLRRMSRLSRGRTGTFSRAMESLETKRLITADDDQITLCDPLTGEPPVAAMDAVNDPANYFTQDGHRIVFNVGNPEALLKWVKASLPAGEDMRKEGSGEYKLRCPFHHDPKPSLNFNPRKNTFHCFGGGCQAKGTTKKLVMQLTGISESEAIQQHARAIGVDPTFEPPDSDAEAIYRYTDGDGNPLYEVLRYTPKRFSQRRWTPEGWVYNLKGVKKTLYKLPEIRSAAIVIITEGEKDADRVNELRLEGYPDRPVRADNWRFPFENLPFRECRVVATTSGGDASWQDGFADLLAPCSKSGTDQPSAVQRRMIVMPDSDVAGQGYKEKIVASLEKRTIPYCVVTFDGFKDVSEYLDADHTAEELAQRITDEMTKKGLSGGVTCRETPVYEDITI